jgi:hypothetical protein
MRPAQKIGAFTAALATSFAVAYGIGDAVNPISTETTAEMKTETAAKRPAASSTPSAPGTAPGGLQVSERGYTLDLDTPRVRAGKESELRFVVRDGRGRPVTEYRREHGKELHLIVASRDLTVYRHLHSARGSDGVWRSTADLPDPGAYRVFADFTPAAQQDGLTLGADLAVTGDYAPGNLPAPSRTAEVDGYTVALAGGLKAGGESTLTFTVTRAGRPVTALQPYLGAYGHLVALRSGDLAYLHVHPHDEVHGDAESGPEVAFSATAPSPGTYRLFLDFKIDGEVRTAVFTVRAGGGAPAATEPAPEPTGHDEAPHGH